MLTKMDCANAAGEGLATGEIDNSNGSTSPFVVHTGVKNLKKFIMDCCLLNDTADYVKIFYNSEAPSNCKMVVICGANATVTQSLSATNSYLAQTSFCSVITDITADGDVTIAHGTGGTWWRLTGTWYAE